MAQLTSRSQVIGRAGNIYNPVTGLLCQGVYNGENHRSTTVVTLGEFNMIRFLLLSTLVFSSAAWAEEKDAKEQPRESVEWVLPVFVKDNYPLAKDEVDKFGKELSSFFDKNGTATRAKENPICCFWVEIWKPEPSTQRGFLLQIEKNGARLTASDPESLFECLKFLKKVSKFTNGKTTIPLGVFSTYKVQFVDDTRDELKANETPNTKR